MEAARRIRPTIVNSIVNSIVNWRLAALTTCIVLLSVPALSQDLNVRAYDNDAASLIAIHVDPSNGGDSNDGSENAPLRTLEEAWNRIPGFTQLTQGYHILLHPGDYSRCEDFPNYMESRWGSRQAPIVISNFDRYKRQGMPMACGLNMFDCRYVYLEGLSIESSTATADIIHLDHCKNILLRNCLLQADREATQEVLKVNQSQFIYVEDCSISGAWDNSIDFVAVQDGHILRNHIFNCGDWGCYVKGGSARLAIAGNTVEQTGTGGITAGQGTGFQFMDAPYIHYEAYDIKIANNFIYNVEGAAFGVQGGYNILVAYNTAMNVGVRSHLLELGYGSRSCDGTSMDPGHARCDILNAAGGWGNSADADGDNYVRIPNLHVFIYNNVFYNLGGVASQWQHLFIAGPYTGQNNTGSNVPTPTRADDDVVFAGNMIWNGPQDHPLGLDDASGCDPTNPTCNETLIRERNAINRFQPDIDTAATPRYHPIASGNMSSFAPLPIPSFTNAGRPTKPAVPSGILDNAVSTDIDANVRDGNDAIGAKSFAMPTSVPSEHDVVRIVPNPASEIIHIYDMVGEHEVRIVDMQGVVVYSKSLQAGSTSHDSHTTIDISSFSKGLYFVLIGSHSKALIVF